MRRIIERQKWKSKAGRNLAFAFAILLKIPSSFTQSSFNPFFPRFVPTTPDARSGMSALLTGSSTNDESHTDRSTHKASRNVSRKAEKEKSEREVKTMQQTGNSKEETAKKTKKNQENQTVEGVQGDIKVKQEATDKIMIIIAFSLAPLFLHIISHVSLLISLYAGCRNMPCVKTSQFF